MVYTRTKKGVITAEKRSIRDFDFFSFLSLSKKNPKPESSPPFSEERNRLTQKKIKKIPYIEIKRVQV